ncbi:conserved hypothetical protein [Tenacibaculum amylolyticum]
MNLTTTHFLLAAEEEKKLLQESSATIPASLSGDGSFWDGANLMGILNTIGGTWAQIEQARNGQPVYVKNAQGSTEDIAPTLRNNFEAQANQLQMSVENLAQTMRLQIQQQIQQNQNPPPKKDNTLLYVGIGAGVLGFLGIIYVITKK